MDRPPIYFYYPPMLTRPAHTWPAAFLPSWPEAGLIRRDPARGDAFIKVSYYGLPQRLAPQLRSARFARLLQERGFDFEIIDRHHWNDYSDTDAVLAVRSFAKVSFDKYPPSKLYNSWLAGVPALLGRESAYQAERRNAYDYFEVARIVLPRGGWTSCSRSPCPPTKLGVAAQHQAAEPSCAVGVLHTPRSLAATSRCARMDSRARRSGPHCPEARAGSRTAGRRREPRPVLHRRRPYRSPERTMHRLHCPKPARSRNLLH